MVQHVFQLGSAEFSASVLDLEHFEHFFIVSFVLNVNVEQVVELVFAYLSGDVSLDAVDENAAVLVHLGLLQNGQEFVSVQLALGILEDVEDHVYL